MKRFRVHGICFVPQAAVVEVQAKDCRDAEEKAFTLFRANPAKYLTGDPRPEEAGDWVPFEPEEVVE